MVRAKTKKSFHQVLSYTDLKPGSLQGRPYAKRDMRTGGKRGKMEGSGKLCKANAADGIEEKINRGVKRIFAPGPN